MVRDSADQRRNWAFLVSNCEHYGGLGWSPEWPAGDSVDAQMSDRSRPTEMVPSSRRRAAGGSISLRTSGVTPGKRCVQARTSSGISS